MDSGVFTTIDRWSDRTMTSLALVSSAIDGIYDSQYRVDPSVRGLSAFVASTSELPQLAAESFNVSVIAYQSEVEQFLSTPPIGNATATLSIALQQLRAYVTSVQLAAARRFRGAIVSRSSIAPLRGGSLRVLNRAGRGVHADEMFRLFARKTLIDLFNEAQIRGLTAEGTRVAVVATLDPKSPISGAPLLIDGPSGALPHYEEVQDKWFHPRSYAVLDRGE